MLVNRIFLGNEEIVKAYLGSEQIYSNTEPFHAQFDLSKGTSSTTLSLPIPSDSDLLIDWGDGTKTISGNSHTYDTIGEYEVKIYGQIRDFAYNSSNNPQKLMRIINWGQFVITRGGVFDGCSNLIIEDLETKVNVETDRVTYLFSGCSSLTTIPNLDTSNVTSMISIFQGCTNLSSIPPLDTSNVTNMFRMFRGCSSLTLATILDLDTSNVNNMNEMFRDCTSLTTIPVLDTSNVTNMSFMFNGCRNLTSIPVELNTSNVTNMSGMFEGCRNLTTIPLLDTSNVTNMSLMFRDCTSLTTIPNLDTSNVTNMSFMFSGCSLLNDDLSGWCVSLIASEPTEFVSNAPLMTTDKHPVWGTCP